MSKLTRWLLTAILSVRVIPAQSLKDCRTVFLQSMPESLDQFISVELLKWGAIKVVTVEEKADCVGTFGRQASKVEIKSSGSALVPSDAKVEAQSVAQQLPDDGPNGKAAALVLVHRESSVMIWAASKSDRFSIGGGSKTLAKKLVDQLKKDYKPRRD